MFSLIVVGRRAHGAAPSRKPLSMPSVSASLICLSVRHLNMRKPHGNARFMARTCLDPFEAYLEHKRRRDAAYRPESFDVRLAHDRIDLAHLFVRQAGIRLR